MELSKFGTVLKRLAVTEGVRGDKVIEGTGLTQREVMDTLHILMQDGLVDYSRTKRNNWIFYRLTDKGRMIASL